MSETRSLSGLQYKLVSHTGTMLGVVTVPYQAEQYLERRDYWRFPYTPQLTVRSYLDIEMGAPIFDYKVGTLVRSYHLRGAVELYGLSLEEFEQCDGCSFSPSAAYLRSIME